MNNTFVLNLFICVMLSINLSAQEGGNIGVVNIDSLILLSKIESYSSESCTEISNGYSSKIIELIDSLQEEYRGYQKYLATSCISIESYQKIIDTIKVLTENIKKAEWDYGEVQNVLNEELEIFTNSEIRHYYERLKQEHKITVLLKEEPIYMNEGLKEELEGLSKLIILTRSLIVWINQSSKFEKRWERFESSLRLKIENRKHRIHLR